MGRRLYETMLAWDTDPSLRETESEVAFAEAWCAIPKVVFSRTLDSVQGNARRRGVGGRGGRCRARRERQERRIGGGALAAAAIELGFVDELRVFRNPILVGGGTLYLPPVTEHVPLDLVETRMFGSRVIYERYARARASRTDSPIATEGQRSPAE